MNDFRFKMRRLGDELAVNRSKLSWKDRLHYQFPPRLAPYNLAMLDANSQVLQNGNIVILSKIHNPVVGIFLRSVLFFFFFQRSNEQPFCSKIIFRFFYYIILN